MNGCMSTMPRRPAWSCWRCIATPAPINIGVGEDLTIKQLAEMVRAAVGYKGEIKWDATQPDGTPRKLLDVTRITSLGRKPRIDLERGMREVYVWFTKNSDHATA